MAAPTGTVVHMEPIKVEDLPMHPDFADKGFSSEINGQRPGIKDFVTSIILEADAAMDADSLKWSGPEKSKASTPSTAKVETGKKAISAEEMRGLEWKDSIVASRRQSPLSDKEEWFGRKSVHENAAKKGTATFAELDAGLRKDHAVQECAYTPGMPRLHHAGPWPC